MDNEKLQFERQRFFYHGTPARNVENILREGLNPSFGLWCVYLAETPENTLPYAFQNAAIDKGAIFKVEILKENIDFLSKRDPEVVPCEWCFWGGTIPPEQLTLLGIVNINEAWKINNL